MRPFFHFGGIGLLILVSIAPFRLLGQDLAPTADEKATLKQPSLVELGKLYRALELPLPPKEAFFAVSVVQNPSSILAPSSVNLYYQLHLATGGPFPNADYQTWTGFKQTPHKHLEVVFTRPPTPEAVLRYLKIDLLPGWTFLDRDFYPELVFAVQCHLLGHSELARFFHHRAQKLATESLDQTLVLVAWNHWTDQLRNPKRDRLEVAKMLRQIVDKYHFFEILDLRTVAKEFNIKKRRDHQELLDRLDLTLRMTQAKPGSLESMIDDLLEDPDGSDLVLPWIEVKETEWDEVPFRLAKPSPVQQQVGAEARLRNLGFQAIPTLIEHVDDRRLARRPWHPFNAGERNTIGRMRTFTADDFPTVAESVREILSTFFDLDHRKATKADYLNSWNQMNLRSEADFVSRKISNLNLLNINFIKFCSEKYKSQSMALYETVLLRNIDLNHFDVLLDSISESALPEATKIELLTKGARSKHLQQKLEALKRLLKLDDAAFSKASLESLLKFTWTDNDRFAGQYRVDIIDLAFHTKDNRSREVIGKYVKNLPLNIQMAVLKKLGGITDFERADRGILSFLYQFLDDATLYQDPKERQVGFYNLEPDLSQIEVRNFAAWQIIHRLRIDIPIKENMREEAWADIRELAKDEVERRLENKTQQ